MKTLFLLTTMIFFTACNSGGSIDNNIIRDTITLNVSVPNAPTSYTINTLENPTIVVKRGQTYTFNLTAGGHPFYIMTAPGTNTLNAYNTGVTGNGNTTGQLIFVVPLGAPSNLFYNCSTHSGMAGYIAVVN